MAEIKHVVSAVMKSTKFLITTNVLELQWEEFCFNDRNNSFASIFS